MTLNTVLIALPGLKSLGAVCALAAALLSAPLGAAPIVDIELNPASPLGGFDLGDGRYATLIGVQAANNSDSLDNLTLTSQDLLDEVTSGVVEGFFYAAGNGLSSTFDNAVLYSAFVSDTLSAGTNANYDRAAFDSLYAIHSTETVVFLGTHTIGVGNGNYELGNPFAISEVPAPGVLSLMGAGLLGLAWRRRRASR